MPIFRPVPHLYFLICSCVRVLQEQDASIKVIGISLADEEVLTASLEMLNLGPVYDSAALHSR